MLLVDIEFIAPSVHGNCYSVVEENSTIVLHRFIDYLVYKVMENAIASVLTYLHFVRFHDNIYVYII